MKSEQRDPREAVLEGAIRDAISGGRRDHDITAEAIRSEVQIQLRKLDAADPIRAMLPEVVEALEGLVEGEGDGLKDLLKARILLTKLRALTATEGGTDDGE